MDEIHQFGGNWTADKLERLRKYLVAYATIMNKKNFIFSYIDAFAGTGYRILKKEEYHEGFCLLDFDEKDSQEFLQGSARIALQVEPKFDQYIFIEKDAARCQELAKLKTDFPLLKNRIIIVNSEANQYLKDFCKKVNWKKNRAVLFLDPYGMEVHWDTMKAIAETKAIDVWYLFPLGIGVNRLLKKDGNINEAWRNKLDKIFGASDWYQSFYEDKEQDTLFGPLHRTEKIADFSSIQEFFLNRLKSIFPGVAENPLILKNSKNNPLYLLCFAASNEKGAPTAIKIAQDILGRF
ncbi:MAG: three-Cys-motif partner protein TcmP [Candidatus Omnitrophota bacterium]|jgi:three-Cys-motif partner protein|nr:MAG: three-Cys-motif partner protein TcmP [Candidatus Omnitrophota bacterium]